jgi:hypothetical protein
MIHAAHFSFMNQMTATHIQAVSAHSYSNQHEHEGTCSCASTANPFSSHRGPDGQKEHAREPDASLSFSKKESALSASIVLLA